MTNVIDHVHRANHENTINPTGQWQEKLEEGKKIISAISKLKYEMARDRKLEFVPYYVSCDFVSLSHARPIPDDGEASTLR